MILGHLHEAHISLVGAENALRSVLEQLEEDPCGALSDFGDFVIQELQQIVENLI